jgi:uncharacterized protein (TIGR02145 family)
MKLIFSFFFVCIWQMIFSQSTVTDVSGNIYKTVKIGNQIWMAENLRTEKFRNGDPIEQITSNRYWQEISIIAMSDTTLEDIYPAMCYTNNTKGRDNALYNWYTVIDSREICPVGWHVPSSNEFQDLLDYLGGVDYAITKLKSITSWQIKGNNLSGFNAKPIGSRFGDGNFGDADYADFWTDTDGGMRNKYNKMWIPGACSILINNDQIKFNCLSIYNIGCSVRCIKN